MSVEKKCSTCKHQRGEGLYRYREALCSDCALCEDFANHWQPKAEPAQNAATAKTCGACRWFMRDVNGIATCRRYPPVPCVTTTENHGDWRVTYLLPHVYDDWACGEWASKTPAEVDRTF